MFLNADIDRLDEIEAELLADLINLNITKFHRRKFRDLFDEVKKDKWELKCELELERLRREKEEEEK